MQSIHRLAVRVCGAILVGISVIASGNTIDVPGYVGSQACGDCHPGEFNAWRGSHHDLAMTEPTEHSVLGDFDNAELIVHGVKSTFFRRDDGWYLRTDGPDGELHEYRIAYTFGWYPLQQYLVEFPGGKFQSLGLAWDSRAREDGGQHWFHLYPDEADMNAGHPLHWTSRDQTWNYQCAECHSTRLDKGYDLATDTYTTTWAEIDVACEACHGPGAEHIEQARAGIDDVGAWSADKGLVLSLSDHDGGVWSLDPDSGLPRRSPPRTRHLQIETCARCHSRRGQILADYEHGKPLGNSHQLALLDWGLYHPDGQIQEEVYVHGSFLQSRMYQAGVTCSNCHDPHSLQLKADGDLVCAQCHLATRYASKTHHHHEPGNQGASCIGCHMPKSLYMVNDARADHSMRIPRPDLSLKIKTPNACNQCHRDRSVQWALDNLTNWYGDARAKQPHYGEALYAGRQGELDAATRLTQLITMPEQPGIVRASALDLLRDYADPDHLELVSRQLADADPLVRQAAVRWLRLTDPRTRFHLAMPLLDDPLRTVRLEAANTLAPLMRLDLPDAARERLSDALDAWRDAQLVTAERPESHLNLGIQAMQQGKLPLARKDYLNALRLDPDFVPAYANLADLYRALGADQEAEQTLRDGLQVASDNADLHHALGLLHVRAKRLDNAIAELAQAVQLAPGNPRYAYVYAVALNETDNSDLALEVLENSYKQHPTDRDTLIALVTMNRDAGRLADAQSYAQALRIRHPNDPNTAALARELLDAD